MGSGEDEETTGEWQVGAEEEVEEQAASSGNGSRAMAMVMVEDPGLAISHDRRPDFSNEAGTYRSRA